METLAHMKDALGRNAKYGEICNGYPEMRPIRFIGADALGRDK